MALAISMLKNIFMLHSKMKHMALAIGVLKNILPTHAKMQDYHLKLFQCATLNITM